MSNRHDHIEIWNRAADSAGDPPAEAPIGDRMLSLAMSLDGSIQANGIQQQWEVWDKVPEAIEALRWFGLDSAADLVAAAESVASSDDFEAQERFELEVEPQYYELDASTALDEALQRRLASHPEDFAPSPF